MAVINRMKSIRVAPIATNAVVCIANFARLESITAPDTRFTPDFPITAFVETFSFGDAVQASILVDLNTLFRRHAVHTEPSVTGSAVPLPTTMQTVTPVAGPAHVTHEINLLPILIFHTFMTEVSHAIIAGVLLYSIFINPKLQHWIAFITKIAITPQASN